jgi:hypothetical protein
MHNHNRGLQVACLWIDLNLDYFCVLEIVNICLPWIKIGFQLAGGGRWKSFRKEGRGMLWFVESKINLICELVFECL